MVLWCVMVVIIFSSRQFANRAHRADTLNATQETQLTVGQAHRLQMHDDYTEQDREELSIHRRIRAWETQKPRAIISIWAAGEAVIRQPLTCFKTKGFERQSHDLLWVASPTGHYILCLQWKAGEAVDSHRCRADEIWARRLLVHRVHH
jgi:hypothetical protein